jgi:UDP-glucose 4-epimerase
MKYLVTGGAGFIGSHLVDRLIAEGHEVVVVDNFQSGFRDQINEKAELFELDICDGQKLDDEIFWGNEFDGIFHLAAIARTPWCIEDPILAYEVNVMGTLNILELARNHGIKRVVMASSNVVYAFMTPYRTSKEALEGLMHAYNNMYEQSVIAFRFSNVYGTRQSEVGPSPNVFASLRKAKKDHGKIFITGDGEQTRDFTHVSDIVDGLIKGMNSDYRGVLDLCTGINTSLNQVAKYFDCPVEYIADRPGDVKHIDEQDASNAERILGWKAKIKLEDGIKDVL